MIEIALADQNDQLAEANLDGTTFYIHVAWNATAAQFTIGLQTGEGETLIEGVTMVAGWPLFFRLRHPFMPLGDFMLITDNGLEVNRKSFVNKTAKLMYLEEKDLADFGVLNNYGRI